MMEQALDKQNIEREKGIYRVTVVGSIVNFLLLVFKFFAAFSVIVLLCWQMRFIHCRTLSPTL